MISILIDNKLEHLQKEVRYSFGFIFQSLGYSYCFIDDTSKLHANDTLVIYAFAEPEIDELRSLSRKYLTIYIPAEAELYDPKAWNAEKIRRKLREVKLLSTTPLLSSNKFDYPAVNYSDDEINAGKLTFDLVGNVFFHLTGMEEIADKQRNEAGRYPETSSAFYKYRETPFVDNMLWLIDSMIKEHSRARSKYTVQKMNWPRAQEAAILLSHSVDDLQKWDVSSLILSIPNDFMMLISLNWKQLWHTLAGKMKYMFTNYELNWNFDEFRRMERDAGMRSTYFIATHGCDDIDYSLDDPDLQEEIRELQNEGSEIGFLMTEDKRNRDNQLTRKQVLMHQLKKDNVGLRQFGFRMDDELREVQASINPSYAMSNSPQENPGFYRGVGIPYNSWTKLGKSSHYEIPVQYRDSFLHIGNNKLLSLDDAKAQIKRFYQTSIRTHGIFALDFRIAAFSDIHYCAKLYPYLMALLKTGKTWNTTADELATWWQKRSRVVIDASEFEFSVFFSDDIDSLCLKVTGEVQVVEIDGVKATSDNNIIKFRDVKTGSIAIIRLAKK